MRVTQSKIQSIESGNKHLDNLVKLFLIIFFDLKNGPNTLNIILEKSDDNLNPKILNEKKSIEIVKN